MFSRDIVRYLTADVPSRGELAEALPLMLQLCLDSRFPFPVLHRSRDRWSVAAVCPSMGAVLANVHLLPVVPT